MTAGDGRANSCSSGSILGVEPMKAAIVLAACICSSGPAVQGRQLSGVVYSDHSGPSAIGAGYVTLSTSVGLIKIHYGKPINGKFTDDRCWDLGAIWNVRTRQEADGTEELVRADCAGRLDVEVHSAWIAVLQYIKSIAERAGHTIGFKQERRGPINIEMGGVAVDIEGYLQFPDRGMCLEMNRRGEGGGVVIHAGLDCYFRPEIEFAVQPDERGQWAVKKVIAVTRRMP